MSEFSSLGDWRAVTALAAATAFVVTSVVLVVALGAARILRSRGPAFRSAILRAGLIGMVICPATSLVLRHLGMSGLAVLPPVEAAAPAVLPIATAPLVSAMPIDRPGENGESSAGEKSSDAGLRPAAARTAETPRSSFIAPAPEKLAAANAAPRASRTARIETLLAGLWIVVSGLLMARLVIANGLIAFIRRRARPAHLETQRECRLIAAQLEVRAPSVLVAPGISGPCLVGWLRPAILLSEDGVEREILIHELAHLKRQDCAWQLLAKLAVAMVWFQPLMWIWAREMERSAEEACDDMVLARDGDRTSYARRLARVAGIAQRRWAIGNAGVGVVGMRSSVGRRIVRILNASNSFPHHLGWRGRLCIALCAAVMSIGLGLIRPAARSMARADEPKAADVAANRHHGRVLDSDGKPVKGAQVFVLRGSGSRQVILDSAQTDADGNFNVAYVTSRKTDTPTEIQAFAAGKGVGTTSHKLSDEIYLMPTTRIILTVVGPDAKPVAGARVFPTGFLSSMFPQPAGDHSSFVFLTLAPALKQSLSGTTDAKGNVTLVDLPRGTMLGVGTDDDRFAAPGMDHRIRLSDDGPVSEHATLQLELGAAIAGTVRFGPTGQPAAGIFVGAQSTNESHIHGGDMTKTDEKGRFLIKQLQPGEYNTALSFDEEEQKDWTAIAHERVTVKAGQTLADIDFSLIKGNLITGKVTTADKGEPIATARVGVYGPAHPHSSAAVQAAVTNADGFYTLRVPAGAQYVYVMGIPAGYKWDSSVKRNVDIEVREGQNATVDFKLVRDPGEKVSGVVIGLDGKPAVGISVQTEDGSPGLHGGVIAITDADGRFHFDAVAPGTPIVVRDGDLGIAKPVSVAKGQGEIKLQLIRRTKLTLRGWITDEQGKPIASANIILSESTGFGGSTLGEPLIGGADGSYGIPNLYTDSRYHVAADADGYGEVQSLVKLDEGMRELPTLKLPRADATIGGVVVTQEGKPVDGVKVIMGNGMHTKTAITDARGQFLFHVVAGTSHSIRIWVKPGVPGPRATGAAGYNDVKLWLPAEGRSVLLP